MERELSSSTMQSAAGAGVSNDNSNAPAGSTSVTNPSVVLETSVEKRFVPHSQSEILKGMVTIKAPVDPSGTSRAPLDLVAVIDRSGSMAGSKLILVKETLTFIVDQLQECDRLAIVAYATDVTVAVDLVSMDAKGKIQALSAVKDIQATSQTNLSGGLLAGVDIIRKNWKKSSVSSVILFTDGLANVGLTNPAQIVASMEGVLKGFECNVFSLGFGSDHQPSLLRAIAQAGHGVYYYIDTEESIATAFAHCVGGLLSVVVQNAILSLVPANGVAIPKVFCKDKKDGWNIYLGDMYSEEQRDIVFEVVVPILPAEQENFLLAKVNLECINVVSCKPEQFQCDIVISRSDARNIVEPVNVDNNNSTAAGAGSNLISSSIKIDMQCNRIIAAVAMDEAVQSIESGQTQMAQPILVNAIQTIEHSRSAQQPYAKSLVADLQECAQDLSSSSTVSAGTKKLSSLSTTHWHQRSSKVTAASSNANQKKMLSLMEKSRRKQILKCDKCRMVGHYARDCLQEAGSAATPEAELQRALQFLTCTKCGKQGHSAVDCLQQNSNTCHVCGKTGHFARECPDKDKCHFCGLTGHVSQECPKKRDVCNKCGKAGHFAKDCTEGDRKSTGTKCFHCGQSGHFARECPQQQQQQQQGAGASSSVVGSSSNNNNSNVAAPSAGGKCHNCGQAGHFARECPNRGASSSSFSSSSSSGARGGCHNCGKPGHFARECPEKRQRRY